MSVHFFIEDDSNPVVYDYDLSPGGALTVSPMFVHRKEDVTLVVLRRTDNGPTAAQLKRIGHMKAEHPDAVMHFHFARPIARRRRTPLISQARSLASTLGARLGSIVGRTLAH
jgi:hypothetical protein